MKQYIQKILNKDIAKKLSLTILFLLILSNVKAQSLSLSLDADNVDFSFLNSNRTLLSGTQNVSGSVYKYSNLATVEGRVIYGKLTMGTASNASIGTGGFDDDTSNASWFQPSITTNVTSAQIEYKLDFFDTATDFPVYLKNFYLNGINLDGNGTGSEKILIPLNEYNNFTRTDPSGLVITIIGNDIEFKGVINQLSGVPSFESSASFYAFYQYFTTSISFKLGSKGGSITNRPIALSLGKKNTLVGTNVTNTGSSTNSTNRTNLGVVVDVDYPLTPIGSTVIFSFQAQNFGPNTVTATNVIVGTKLPSGYTYVSHSAPTNTTYNPTTGIWTAGNLAVSASKTLTIKATVNGTPNVSNYVTFANISGDQTELLTDNNSRNATIELHTPFVNCSNKLFLSQYENTGGTDLYTLNYATNPITIDQVGEGTASNVKINAMGYNPLDNFIYGLNIGTNHLFRIGDNNISVYLGAVQNLPVDDYISGDIDKDGNFYVKANNGTSGGTKIYKINITTKTASAITLNAQLTTADFAYNLDDGLLYGVDQNTNKLYKINPVSATITFIGLTNHGNNFGAMYTDGTTGAVYGNANNGYFYIFNKTTGAATLVSDSIGTVGNDGAHCPSARIFFPAELSITKTDNKTHYIPGTTNTYTIVVSNAGPSTAINAVIKDLVPSGIPVANMSYSRIYSGGGAIALSGSSINDVVNIEPGAFYTYTVDLLIPSNYTENLVNTATVTISSTNVENDLSNNSATDTDLFCTPPSISAQPAPTQTICKNATPSTLSVTASGTGTLTYQWYSNVSNNNTTGTAINLATSSTYVPSSATVGTTYYYVIATGTCGSVISSTSTVVVTALTAITAQPATTQTICRNATPSTLSVTVSGTGTFTYQWYSNATNSNTTGTAINLATSATYVPSSATVGTTYYYVIASGTCSSVTSSTSAVVVNALTIIPNAPTNIVVVQQDEQVTALSVSSATGTNLTYQWYSNTTYSNSGGTLIEAATAATYTPSSSILGTKYYYAIVTGSCGAETSVVNGVTVIEKNCNKPAVLDPAAGTTLGTEVGISALNRVGVASTWPKVRESGWIALEAKTKGFVINRVAFNVAGLPVVGATLVLTSPVEGMIVYDTTNNCLKVYTTTDGINFAWFCMETQACPE